jgi:hypothetical protein
MEELIADRDLDVSHARDPGPEHRLFQCLKTTLVSGSGSNDPKTAKKNWQKKIPVPFSWGFGWSLDGWDSALSSQLEVLLPDSSSEVSDGFSDPSGRLACTIRKYQLPIHR